MKSYYFVYETTNLINGKKYIGQHCTRNLNDGYYGSQKDLINDIKNKGHQYEIKILKWCNNIWHLGYEEFEEIKRRNALKDPNYYNTKPGYFVNYWFEFGLEEKTKKIISDKVSGENHPMFGKKQNEETKQKRRKTLTGSKRSTPAWNKGLSKITDERVRKYGSSRTITNDEKRLKGEMPIPWNKKIL